MEDAFIIRGGKKLSGNIRLSGAKNVALKVIISALMFEEEVSFENVPKISDVVELLHLLEELGAKAYFAEKNTVVVDGRTLNKSRVDLLHASKTRVSFMLFAPLLYRFGSCFIPNPGGCRIGARPIDRIVEGMRKLGVSIEYESETGYYEAHMREKPHGHYIFTKPSHTGTELLILLSIFAKDKIVLGNVAFEPEIDELIRFLNTSGARIKREGKSIIIHPVTTLKHNAPFPLTSDRNEAVTFASLAVATRGQVSVSSIDSSLLDAFIKKLKEVGVGVDIHGKESIRFYYKGPLKSSHITTAPHPGFMTDWQPNWAILMLQAHGESIIHERVFENRFSYVEELRRLGAEIDFVKIPVKDPFEYFFFNFDPRKKYNQAIRITGPQVLHGGVLDIADLRAGASLATAALTVEGESVISGASILERGYEDFEEKVKSLGGDIEKI